MENWRKTVVMLSELSKIDINSLFPLPNSVEEFLHRLKGPRYLVIDGQDNSRTRVFVTLLHGNEPSGIMALLRWLKENQKPAVRIVCIVASVKTALEGPLFHYRTLPGNRDINRCFQSPYTDETGQLARAILDLIKSYQPEAVIDMHNTSGSGPAFAVATYDHPHHHALSQPFTDKLIITHLKLGALMDLSEVYCPIITIEAGGRLDQWAHEVAWKGLYEYFTEKDILKKNSKPRLPRTIVEPIRIELKKGISLSYADTSNTEFDVVLLSAIDHFNFTEITPQTQLGWVNRGDLENFEVSDCKYHSDSNDWLRIQNGKLYPANNILLFMITTNPVIAIDDCLFYAVKTQKTSSF